MSSQNKEGEGGKVNGSRVVHHATIYAKSQMNDDDDDKKKKKKKPSSSPYTLGTTTAASSMYLYMECMKNHAASVGGNARDGCGEFMAGGEQGTLEALKCSACNCHRNFHRKIHHEQFQTTVPLSSVPTTTPSSSSKRFRTKFSEEQKEKMYEFAEKCKWKIQRLEDSVVRSFCHEIGINRNVLKAWIHNNKYHQHNANNKNM